MSTVEQALASPSPAPSHAHGWTPARRLIALAALALLGIVAFMTWGVQGDWAFALHHRATRLAALLLVGYAVAVSTVLFQTLARNRILTPSVMGFDAAYVLIQALLVFALGASGLAQVDARLQFGVEVAVMVGVALLLFRWLFGDGERSLHLTMLVGIVLGVLFRGLTSFMVRVIDPNEFLVLQDRLFASFNLVDTSLLGISAAAVAVASAFAWHLRRVFDVLALGRDLALNLGVDYRRVALQVLALVAVLVAVSTALVGPVTFLGLLVANLAVRLMGTDRHRWVLPAASLLGVILLVGGQVVLERGFGWNMALSVVIEFLGGLMFIALLLRRGGAR